MTWRMTHGKTDSPAVQRHQERLLEHRQKDELVQRLGQYEDTGLTPEEIKALEDFKNSKDDRCQTFSPD